MDNSSAGPGRPSTLDSSGAALCAVAALIGVAGFALAGFVGGTVAVIVAGLGGAFVLARSRPRPVLAAASAEPPVAGPATEPAAPTPQPPHDAIPEDRIDALTGLANENGLKAWFIERLPRLVEERKNIIVLSASLEGLETIVKSRGQSVADKVLIEVARRITAFANEEGIAARTGGGEFASKIAVVPEHSLEYASETAARLAEVLQRPVELSEGVVWIGGCVGAAAGPAREGEGVLARARKALAGAKQIGLGHYVVDRG